MGSIPICSTMKKKNKTCKHGWKAYPAQKPRDACTECWFDSINKRMKKLVGKVKVDLKTKIKGPVDL